MLLAEADDRKTLRPIGEKKELIRLHVAETGSVWGDEIINDLRSYIGHFWLVKPKAASIDSLIEHLRRAA